MVKVLNKLQQETVIAKYKEGRTLRELAPEFGVSYKTIGRVLKGSNTSLRKPGRRVKYVTHRVCTGCGKDKPIENFGKDSRFKTGYGAVCRECLSKRAKIKSIKANFGITIEDFRRMEAEQHGVCGICGKKETRKRRGSVARLSVDHHHKKGYIRGLLCTRCNTAIGLFKDDPDLLRKAIRYIEKHGHKR